MSSTVGASGVELQGWYGTSVAEMVGTNLRAGTGFELAHSVKLWALLGEHLRSTYHGRLYGKAQNLVPSVTAAYNRAFEDVDLLVMPTTQNGRPTAPAGIRDDRGDARLGVPKSS